jgi:sortase A
MQRQPTRATINTAHLEHSLVVLSSLVWTAVVLLVLVVFWGYQDAMAQWQLLESGDRPAQAAELPTVPPPRLAAQVLPETPLEGRPLPTATITPRPTVTPTPRPTATFTAAPPPPPFVTPWPTPRPATPTPTLTLPPTPAPPTPTIRPPPTATPITGGPTRLVIESLGIDTPVVPVTWTTVQEGKQVYSVWQVADFAAGWHSTSARPGEPGNTVISGHHNIKGEVFRYLADIQEGAAVDVYVGETVYRYYVEQKLIVKEKGEPLAVRQENARWIDRTDDVRLTLITCWPYTNNTHRVIVVARPRPAANGG